MDEYLGPPVTVDEQVSMLNDWVKYGRCLHDCLMKTDDANTWASGISASGTDPVDYFTKPEIEGFDDDGDAIDPEARKTFKKIFNGEDPLNNFNSLDENYKKKFLEAAIKYMAAVEAAFNGEYWKDKLSSNFGGDKGKEAKFKKYHDLVNIEWT